MLSHLRLHRRAPSNPASPQPDQASPPPWDTAAQREHAPPAHDVSPALRPDARLGGATQLPPKLPPIARVTSAGSDLSAVSTAPRDDAPPPSLDSSKPPARAAYDVDAKAGFIGGVALRNYNKAAQTPSQPADAAASAMPNSQLPGNQLSRSKPPPPPIDTSFASRPAIPVNKQAKTSWFSAPNDSQATGAHTGKRHDESALGPASEPQKGRKGLPFLKNPMSSLLMRRKTAQAVVETQPPAPSYDPRIKGTRVHDFSAPRPKKSVSTPGAIPTVSRANDHGAPHTVPLPSDGDFGSDRSFAADRARQVQTGRTTPLDADRTDLSPPQVPPKDESSNSFHTSSSVASRRTQTATLPSLASASVRTTASRQLSLSGMSRQDSVASAVPRHMKSTSSRFSFDMIGAAGQEKLLEERHREREQYKKPSGDPAAGDARFDDFDEDFDYDAMMDDDGLEERIPGVNADYEDEEDLEAAMDPDNDQENFAGFVFQRSNPESSLASPHTPGMLATPRDVNGTVIGFAMTKDTTPVLPTADSPMFPIPVSLPHTDDCLGLGMESPADTITDARQEEVYRPSQPTDIVTSPPPRAVNDDIYFDDGLADELDFEHDGTVFDEAIFDNIDTDQYGRPIPGAFAQAKEAMQAAHHQQQPSKRDSDMTSSASGHEGAVQSTGHTSLSVGLQPVAALPDDVELPPSKPAPVDPAPTLDLPGRELAYQAALAEAAQQAAASGKFRRSSSPDVLAGLSDTHLGDSNGLRDVDTAAYLDDYTAEDDDDAFANDFGDDFDFDDEAIIAEANASALANDADGFYGQEFGFYSAPLPSHPHHPLHHQPPPSSSSSAPPTTSGVLTTENLFQYANGGYFGPPAAAGPVGRSTSGRVVCREPNLTPITERSEYSNRNSVMSFTLPPAITDGRNSAAAMASPGLAQLALLSAAEDGVVDSTMSLSALMKLRSKAWGGSQPSLSGGSREGSPRSERAVPAGDGGGASPFAGTVPAHLAGHVRVNSGLSLWSCFESEAEDGDGGGEDGGGGRGERGASPAPAGWSASSMPPPPRPGSAGAVLGGAHHQLAPPHIAAALYGGGGNAPPRPQSLFLPPQVPLTMAPSPGQQCSPVLEGEEAEAEEAAFGAAVVRGFALAPALPVGPVQRTT